MVAQVSTWSIALIGSLGAILGAIVGGAISFAGIVYRARREGDAQRRAMLVEAISAFAFAADLFAAHLEQFPPTEREPSWAAWFDKYVLGGPKGVWLFQRLLGEHLLPSFSEETRELRRLLLKAGARIGFVAPEDIRNHARRMIEYLITWQGEPGPSGLANWSEIRLEFGRVARTHVAA